MSKRPRSPGTIDEDVPISDSTSQQIQDCVIGRKRRSRFADDSSLTANEAVAAARAAEIAKSLIAKGNLEVVGAGLIQDAATMHAQLAAQIASVSSILQNAQSQQQAPSENVGRKATFRPLLLDAQGREIDEFGNVVQSEGPVKTLAANVAARVVQKKKENPYLAHRIVKDKTVSRGDASVLPSNASLQPLQSAINTSSNTSMGPQSSDTSTQEEQDGSTRLLGVDDRLILSSRANRGKRALKFSAAGTYTAAETADLQREQRKIAAGLTTGRRAPELAGDAEEDGEDSTGVDAAAEGEGAGPAKCEVPAAPDAQYVLNLHMHLVEWWDEAFLPKEKRDARKKLAAKKILAQAQVQLEAKEDKDLLRTGATERKEIDGSVRADEQPEHLLLSLRHCKTHPYVQHPVPVKALGGERPVLPLPMFLTKKERKRLRKSRRQELEQEKRDKQMMGLIPPPEPKFKLSNFMRILGDQAVADPSKVEKRVMAAVRQREIDHQMRNLAAKLTPAQRWEKAQRKREAAAASLRQVHVAAFFVRTLHAGHRYKLDRNSQQLFLSGLALICASAEVGVVVVEGGQKDIRKFSRLMLHRVKWAEPQRQREVASVMSGVAPGMEMQIDSSEMAEEHRQGRGQQQAGLDPEVAGSDSSSDDSDDEPEDSSAGDAWSFCRLLWQGVAAKRLFSGFKFQECKTVTAARKVLDEKHVAHFWDLAVVEHGQERGQASQNS